MSEWRSACVIAPYPPELLPNTPRRPLPPHLKRCSMSGSISCRRKSSQAPIDAELMYWLPPSRVKQSGKATTTGGMRCSPISRSSRSGRFSPKPTQLVLDRPLPVKPTRSTSRGNPCPSCPAGTYTSTTRTDGSPSILLVRAWLSMVTRVTEPIGPKNLRMRRALVSCWSHKETSLPRRINPFDDRKFIAEPIGKSGSPLGQEHYDRHEAPPTAQACGASHLWPRPEVFS